MVALNILVGIAILGCLLLIIAIVAAKITYHTVNRRHWLFATTVFVATILGPPSAIYMHGYLHTGAWQTYDSVALDGTWQAEFPRIAQYEHGMEVVQLDANGTYLQSILLDSEDPAVTVNGTWQVTDGRTLLLQDAVVMEHCWLSATADILSCLHYSRNDIQLRMWARYGILTDIQLAHPPYGDPDNSEIPFVRIEQIQYEN